MSKRRIPKLASGNRSALEHPESRGLTEAQRAARAQRGSPDEADAPPVSTFPMTPAAREALRLWNESH